VDALTFFDAVSGDDSACALTHDLRVIAVSPGWVRFARANGGDDVLVRWGTGASIATALPEPLLSYYRGVFAQVATQRHPWDCDYECSSADVYRLFRMRIYPLDEGFGIVHALRIQEPYYGHASAPDDAYLEEGLIAMCAYCRKVRHRPTGRWDWVPAYVSQRLPNISHGMCPGCASHYWGDA
jgi:hypothetical protein